MRGPIDEECRRRFERAWREAGSAQIGEFLPDPASPAYAATLEELLLIDLEMRTKRGDPPSVGDYARRFALDGELRGRLEREKEELVRRHAVPGGRIGRYELRELVGQGAFARVWRAFDPELSREVAVKRLRASLAGSEEARARFQREARSAARLRHPAIVTVHEVGADPEGPYLVADLIRGPTLAVAMCKRAFGPDEAARLVARVADALDYAHQCGVVHRDVKPGNVLLDESGLPHLADFGLARLGKAETALTRHGDLLGTPAYMSPEQARGDVEATGERSDIYSLGVVLYELMCGRLPFERENTAALSYAVVHTDPAPPRRHRGGLPADLESVCLKALAREPQRRYATAGAFADDLRRYLARESVHARPRGRVAHAALWVRRNPALAASLAAIVAVGALGLLRVLQERARFREQREQAQASLYRALVRETEAHLAAPRGSGRDTAWRTLGEATRLDVPVRDPLELRNLALRCLTAEGPWFRQLAAWEGGEPPRHLAFAPAGDVAAEAGPAGTRLRVATTGRTLAEDPAPCDALAFAPDGRRLYTAHADAVAVRDAATLAPLAEIEAPGTWEALAAGPLGRRLALAGDEVLLLDLEGGPARRLAHASHCVAFAPDGERVAAGGRDGMVRVWNVHSGEVEAETFYPNAVRCVAYAPDGALAGCIWESYTVSLVDQAAWEQVSGTTGHEAPVRASFFGTDGLLVSASADGTLGAWDRTPARLAAARAPGGEIRTAAGAGRLVLTVQADGRRVLWELTRTQGKLTWYSQHAAVFVPGALRVFAGHQGLAVEEDGVRGLAVPAHGAIVWGVAADPVHGRLASGTHVGGIRLLNRELTEAHVLQEEGEISWAAAFSPDGRLVAAGTGDQIVLWDTESRAERARLHGNAELVVALVFHPHRPWLISASLDATVRAWDWERGAEVRRLGDGIKVHGLAFGRELVAACHDGTLRVWDGDLEPVRTVPVGEDPVWTVAFGPHGVLASGSQAGVVRLWDPGTWRVLAELTGVRRVRNLTFDDTGRYLVASAWLAEGAVWDLLRLRQQLATLDLDWE